ncbi:iron-containing alcohol dehydrogenase [Lichenihabitans psoromatis]|uniref:iron-containing alcohol dehydrogenase n=1 Tax=Lichenihabitans psoromatis TaxID=2528642 RepID=UPI001036A2DE|nr:iron-containing alcohol dehydrogenase [Lichenihabitans psoromatis]
MSVHQLAQVPAMTIGAGARKQIGDLAASLVAPGSPVLLVADPGLAATGMTAELEGLLVAAGFPVIVFSDIKSDPTIAQADAAAKVARSSGAKLMVALGGGSALDLGKAVAVIAGADAPAETYALCAAPLPAGRLKIICMPTTSGTGSETTRTAILSAPDGAKLWFWGDELKADHAILDPELTVSLPAQLTAATGIDALVHAVEAATNRNAHAGNDLYAHEAIRLVAIHLETAVKDPTNLVAREGVQRAAALAGTAIDNCGTAIAHAIGHAMASLRPMHHGRAVGVAMLASLPWVVSNDPDGRFAACAAAMGAEPTAQGFIDAYGDLVRRTGLRIAVSDDFTGITPEALAAQMVRPENAPMIRSTVRESSPADLLAIAQAVLALR